MLTKFTTEINTGESLPVLKSAVPVCAEALCYDADTDKRFTLYCGTKAMEVRRVGGEQVAAIVLRCGFATAKVACFET